MKQSISSVWLLGLIIVFILIFACYITITINYSASFKLKNEVLNIIQKHHGLTSDEREKDIKSVVTGGNVKGNVSAFKTINLYLRGNAYTAEGYCPDDGKIWYGVSNIYDGDNARNAKIEKAANNKKYYYCVAKYDADANKSKFQSIYYKVRLFYKFEVPVLSEFFSIKVEGMTDEIYDPVADGLEGSSDKFFTKE